MLSIHSVAPPRPLSFDASVLSTHACAEAQTGLEGLVQNFLQLARHFAAEDLAHQAAAFVQPLPPAEDVLYTVKQAASVLDVSRQTIHNWVRKGDLTAYKIGGRTYFKKEELISSLRKKVRPDGFRKNARRSFSASAKPFGKEVAYA